MPIFQRKNERDCYTGYRQIQRIFFSNRLKSVFRYLSFSIQSSPCLFRRVYIATTRIIKIIGIPVAKNFLFFAFLFCLDVIISLLFSKISFNFSYGTGILPFHNHSVLLLYTCSVFFFLPLHSRELLNHPYQLSFMMAN